MKYIKANTEFIRFFITHRVEICDQHKRKYFYYADGSPLHLSEQDRLHGVIRDKNGTSMHFNTYEDSNHAKRALIQHVAIFEDDVQYMNRVGHLNLFVRCFEYDAAKGCIEARTARSMDMANKIRQNNGEVTLDILMYSLSLTAAFKDDLLSGSEKRAYAHRFVHPHLSDKITKEKIDAYLTNILAIDFSEPVELEAIAETKTRYKEISKKCTAVVMGRSGTMVQHYFISRDDANQFLTFIKSALRQVAGIRRAQIVLATLDDSPHFLVRLNQQQYVTISGGDGEPLISIAEYLENQKSEKINTLKLKILDARQKIMNGPEWDKDCLQEVRTYDGKLLPRNMEEIVKKIDGAIMQPSLQGYQEALHLSVMSGADLFSKDAKKNTVLHRAAAKDEGKALDALIASLSQEHLNKHFFTEE